MKGTCIVGIAHKGAVFLGCDSMASTDYVKATIREPKIFRVGDALIGVCGTIRIRDVIEFLPWPERAEGMTDDREYLVRLYIPTLRQAMKDAGVLATDNGLEEFDGGMLMGYRNRLFQIDSGFSLLEHDCVAIGSGAEYAMGSLFSTSGEPQKRIKTALQAACEFSPSCGPPFVIEKL